MGGVDGLLWEVRKEAEGQEDLLSPETDRLQSLDKNRRGACQVSGEKVKFLRSGSRRGDLTSPRKEIALKPVYEYGNRYAVSYMLKKR